MSYLRFHHVFVVLMGLSAVAAFVVPQRYAQRFHPHIQGLFAPVSRPVWKVAAWVSNRVAPPVSDDPRAAQTIREENQQLRAHLVWLQAQFDELSHRDLALSELGPLRDLCRLVKVVGGDSGTRQSLAVAASSFQGIRDEQYVVCPGGLVGQIQGSGAAGAQVRLITDPAFHVRIKFVRLISAGKFPQYQDDHTPIVLAEGAGDGLIVRELSLDVIGLDRELRPLSRESGGFLRVGDVAVLSDGECPRALQGEMVGKVVSISHRRGAPLFAEVHIQPEINLKRLGDVMVMVRDN